MNIRGNKLGLWIMPVVLAGILSGCFFSSSNNTGSGSGTEVQFSALSVVNIPGLTATLDVTGMGSYPMTVNPDNTVTASIGGITPGLRTFTVTYFANGVELASASKIANVVAGQNVSISFTAQEIDRNFDDDYDGWTNLAEVLWGSAPTLATSMPPSENPVFVINTNGGQLTSTSYTLQDTLGEGVESNASTSLDYAMTGGFQAYH